MAGALSLLGPLVLLFCGTLVCGLSTLVWVRETRRCITLHATQRRVRRLANCLADGMFLAICFLYLVPRYLAEMKEAFSCSQIALRFPLPAFIMAVGFLLMLVMEQSVQAYREESRGSRVDRQAVVMKYIRSHGQEEQNPYTLQPSFELMLKSYNEPQESPGVGRGLLSQCSATHCFILVLTLSLQSLFEGLTVGLDSNDQQILEISTALLLHKGAIALGLMLQLTRYHIRPAAIAGGLLVFASTSPLAIGLGAALEWTAATPRQHLAYSSLQGLTTGSFIYITCMEILPHELGSSQNRLLKIMLLLTGFAVVTGLLFIKI